LNAFKRGRDRAAVSKSALAIERDNERTAVNAHGAFGCSARRNPIR